MTLQARRILYISFVILFFAAAPPLVLYTAGFRYDFTYNRVVETGSLVVKSTPPDAAVRLNGELYRDATPTIINTILPGKIKLLVEKEGYHSWEKEIEIKPRVTAFEEDVVLFARTRAAALTEHPAVRFWWNAGEDKLAYTTQDNALRLFNTLNQKDTLIANLPEGDTALSWSPREDAFFFGRKNSRGQQEFIVVDAESLARIIPLAPARGVSLASVQWDPRTAASLYALNQKRELVRFNYLLQTQRTVSFGPVLSYLAEENRILLISESADKSAPYLSWIDPALQSTVHLLAEVRVSRGQEFVATNSHYIALRNERAHELVIIDPTAASSAGTSDSEPIIIPRVREFAFSANGAMLVHSDGFGIYARKLTTPLSVLPRLYETSALVTRYSKPVALLALTGRGSHVFYTVSGDLRVNDVASASEPRSTTLLSGAQEMSGLWYGGRGNALSFIDADGILSTLALSLENPRTFLFGN